MPEGKPLPLEPPLNGVRGDKPPYLIPPGYLWRAQNMLDRFGELRTRPGLQRVATPGPGARISGGAFFKNASAVTQVVAATQTKWFKILGNVWTDISGGVTLTNSADDPARFTVFPSGGITWLIGVNNTDVPHKWDGAAANFVVVGGTPPIAKDVTVCGNFVVLGNVVEAGVRSPSGIRVSDFNNLDSYVQYTRADLSDTNDDIVAVRAITRTSFAIYKERSIWMAWAQLGLFPFRLEPMEYRPGPVSPSAVVRANQVHYYLGTDARIHRFDGISADVISAPIDAYLLDLGLTTNFRVINRTRAWGLFNYFDRTVYFFYPGAQSPDPLLGISYNLDSGSLFLHAYPFALTAGWEGDDIATLTWNDLTGTWNAIGPGSYETWDTFGGTIFPTTYIGSVAGQVYRQKYDNDDDGTVIMNSWEFPLKTWFGLQNNTHIDGIENFFRQTAPGPLVTVQVGVSPAMAEPGDPTYTTIGTHDTSLLTRQKLSIPKLDARFWSIKFSMTHSIPARWRGGMAAGFPEEVPQT